MRCGSSAASASMAVSMRAARRAQIGLGALELRAHIGEPGLELRQAPRGIGLARLRRLELRPPVDVLPMQAVDVDLHALAPVLAVAHPLAA